MSVWNWREYSSDNHMVTKMKRSAFLKEKETLVAIHSFSTTYCFSLV